MAEIHDLTALQQAAALRAGGLSPAEVVEHCLRRIERLDETLGAFVTVTADLARDQAARLGAELRDGQLRSTLHGVPVPVKDVINTPGVRTTYGAAIYAENVPDVEDTVATRLRAGGTVLLGKTNVPEFALAAYTENRVAPPARTPWDLARSAGGSSGGAAAAVAGGLAPVAHGNDGGGSVRTPASCCGLVGLKPSRGRVSGGPVKPDLTGWPVDGVLARTVRDAAAVLDLLAGPAPGDPYVAAPLAPGDSFLAAAGRPPGRVRVGRWDTPMLADVALSPDARAAYDGASRLLEELGHDVEDVEAPIGPGQRAAFETVWTVLATGPVVPPGRDGDLMPLTRYLRERGADVTGPSLAAALAELQLAARVGLTRLAPYDLLLSPTLPGAAPAVGSVLDEGDPAADFRANERVNPYGPVYNITGQPAVSLPVHHAADGLPVGVTLAARPGEEATLLAVAAQVEQAAPWADRRPPGW